MEILLIIPQFTYPPKFAMGVDYAKATAFKIPTSYAWICHEETFATVRDCYNKMDMFGAKLPDISCA